MSFKSVQASISKRSGVPLKNAGAILASSSRNASPAAKRKNPNLRKVKGSSDNERTEKVKGPREERAEARAASSTGSGSRKSGTSAYTKSAQRAGNATKPSGSTGGSASAFKSAKAGPSSSGSAAYTKGSFRSAKKSIKQSGRTGGRTTAPKGGSTKPGVLGATISSAYTRQGSGF